MLRYPELDAMEIMAVGDFHLGDPNHSPKILDDIVEWASESENRFITIDGDIFNAAITSSISDVYSEEFTMDKCMELFGEFIDKITPEKILVCIDGNHDQRVWKSVGIDPVRYVCSSRGVRYSQGEAYLTIKLGSWNPNKANPRMIMYTLFVTHGVGGGRTAGGKINTLLRLSEIVIADIYIQGHQHDPVIKPKKIYEFSSQGNSVVERDQIFIVTGSCLERGGYAVAKAYSPVSHVSPVITLSGREKKIQASI